MDNADILLPPQITPEQAKEASVIFTLVDRDEVLETIEDIGTTLITAIGLCKHDYSDSPCGKYYACVRGCSEYYRIKEIRKRSSIYKNFKLNKKLEFNMLKQQLTLNIMVPITGYALMKNY
jgi:hypothetical protein